ncbi:MAG: ABC transporter ATP-binding protein [Thermoplasmata archaeon]|nr:ABC transporter ATP-binding protein [Thermoplasmata archaeon]
MIELSGIEKIYKVRNPDHRAWRRKSEESRFEELQALKGIDLKARKGEILGILGPNGAGKTTLMKIMAGLLIPEHGTGTVNGYDLFKERNKARTSVNLSRSGDWVIFDYKLSILHNLRYWGVVMGVPWKDLDSVIEEALTAVGLETKRNEYPENLSSGMRQKMSLARCLLSDRPIYLFDEPTANIDPISAKFIRDFAMSSLAGTGKTVIISTHNLWEAEMICDRIMIIDEGKKLVEGPTEQIKKTYGGEYALVRLSEVTDTLIFNLEALSFVEQALRMGETWERGDKQQLLKVTGDVKSNINELVVTIAIHNRLFDIEIKEPSLNDVFMKIVEGEE